MSDTDLIAAWIFVVVITAVIFRLLAAKKKNRAKPADITSGVARHFQLDDGCGLTVFDSYGIRHHGIYLSNSDNDSVIRNCVIYECPTYARERDEHCRRWGEACRSTFIGYSGMIVDALHRRGPSIGCTMSF